MPGPQAARNILGVRGSVVTPDAWAAGSTEYIGGSGELIRSPFLLLHEGREVGFFDVAFEDEDVIGGGELAAGPEGFPFVVDVEEAGDVESV